MNYINLVYNGGSKWGSSQNCIIWNYDKLVPVCRWLRDGRTSGEDSERRFSQTDGHSRDGYRFS